MEKEPVRTGIDIIGPVPWGTHFCQFYQTQKDLLDVLIPYFKAGLENNEFCMWITAEPLSAQAARRAMHKTMPDFADRLAKGQIEILPHTDWYLKEGEFDQQRVLDGWVKKLNGALAAGYAGLRLSGNTFWLEKPDWKSFIDYEEAVNDVIGQHRMLALCTYSLAKCGATEVMDVIRNHEFALIRKEGNWEVIENAVCKQAKQTLLEGERKYRGLYQAVAGGIVVQDKNGIIVEANMAAREILGLTLDEITGRTSSNPEWEAIREDGSPFPGEEHPAMVTLRTGKAVRGVVMGVFNPGSRQHRWILINSEPMRDEKSGGVEMVTTTFLDITERKRRDEKILTLTRLYAVLSRANEAIVRIGDVKSLYSEICRIVAEESGLPLVWIGQVEEQNVIPWAWSGLAADYLKGIKVQVQGDFGGGPTGTCIRENRAVVNNNFATNTTVSPWRKAASDYGFRASAAFPLYCDGKAIGALSLYSFEPNAFDADQIRLLESLSSDVSYALDSIRREERRVQAEKRLEFQANILSHIFDAIVVVDSDRRITYWNNVAEILYGVPAEQAIGQKLEKLRQHVWLNPKDERDAEEALAAKGQWTGENIHVKNNGERIYVRSSVSVISNEDGTEAGMVTVMRDRTKLWQAEQELKLLNERMRQQAEDRLRATDTSFRLAITSSADGIVLVRKDGIIRFANPAAEGLLGRGPGDLVGTVFSFPLVEGMEIDIPRENGERAIAEMRIVELDWEGAPAYLATLRDVTRRKQGLLALQESETRLRLLLDQIPCVSWTLDTKLRFTSFTGSGMEDFSAPPDQILGLSLAEYFKVNDLDFTPFVVHRQALQGTPATYELSRGERTFYGRVEPLRDGDDHIVGVVGVAFDITNRKLAEEQLRSLSHRLVTAQENERRKIARELHDEVGQSLTALKLSLDKASVQRSTEDAPQLGQAREVLRELMVRVRSMSLELRPTMLDDLGLLPTLLWHFERYTAQTGVRVHFKHRGLRRDLPQDTITAAYRIVQEALTNVARHAQVTEVLVCVRAERDALIVEVEDQGVGFDPDSVAFASMGLNGMRERALALNGKLLVQSKPGEGVCVIAELPLPYRRRKRTRSKENDNHSSS